MDTETPRLKKAAAVRALLRRDDAPCDAPRLDVDDGNWGWETRGERIDYGPADWDPTLRRGSKDSKASMGSPAAAREEQRGSKDSCMAIQPEAGRDESADERFPPTGRFAISLARPSPFPRGDSDDEEPRPNSNPNLTYKEEKRMCHHHGSLLTSAV